MPEEESEEDSELSNLANILTDRILDPGSLDSNLGRFFTSNAELEVAVHLSKLLVSAIRDFTTTDPDDQLPRKRSLSVNSDLSNALPVHSDTEDRDSHRTVQHRSRRSGSGRSRSPESRYRKPKRKLSVERRRSRKSGSGSKERTRSPESRKSRRKYSESSKSGKPDRSVSPEKSKSRKYDRSPSPENMEATYQKYLKSLGQEVTSFETENPISDESYLKDFQEMEQLLASKNSASKNSASKPDSRKRVTPEKTKIQKSLEKSSKRSRRRHSSSSSGSSRRREKSRHRSKSRDKTVAAYEPPASAVTEKDIYRHLQKAKEVMEPAKNLEQDIYHHLRNKYVNWKELCHVSHKFKLQPTLDLMECYATH